MVRSLLLSLLAGSIAVATDANYAARINGEVLHANTVEFGPLTFRDAVTTPALVGRELVFDKSTAKAYGGEISGRLAVDLALEGLDDGRGSYRGRFALSRADLALLLRQLGGNQQNLSGELSGWIAFTLPTDHPELMTGEGELLIANGALVQLPVLANLLIGDPVASRGQDRLEVHFRIADGRVLITNAQLSSPAARISIRGYISFDGTLALNLEPDFANRIASAITGGMATFLLNPLTRRAGRFIVRGQIAHPMLVSDPFGNKGE